MTSRRAYWDNMAERLEINSLAKDLHPTWNPILKKYTDHSKMSDEAKAILENNTDMKSVLDFGTGLGRNHDYLQSLFKEVNGYDIPIMISRGNELGMHINSYSSNWNEILLGEYDLVYECVCFQHMDIADLALKLVDISKRSRYLYINSRSYNDTGRDWTTASGGYSIASVINQLDLFTLKWTDTNLDTAMNLLDETHYQMLFKSKGVEF